jgi:hypothetical protein
MENLIPLIRPALDLLLAIVITIGMGIWKIVKLSGQLIADIFGGLSELDRQQVYGFAFLILFISAMTLIGLSWL